MKKAVAFLLAFLIFVTPMTTFVKADVVIGDNDENLTNENSEILGRKLALLESLSDLALSGATEFTISNANDVDSYLDSLWGELNDAIDYLDSGEWVGDLQDALASKYFTNLVQYRDYIGNRGKYLSFDLGEQATNLLSVYFADNIFGKKYTQHYDLALNVFKSLSALNHGTDVPIPEPDFDFIRNVNNLFTKNANTNVSLDFYSLSPIYLKTNSSIVFNGDLRNYTFMGEFINNAKNLHLNGTHNVAITSYSPIISIYLDTTNPNNVTAQYTSSTINNFIGGSQGNIFIVQQENFQDTVRNYANPQSGYWDYRQTTFNGLSTAINYINTHYSNINLYVDDVPWVLVGASSNPTIDIDGILKLFGTDTPQQYYLQPGTKIDYDELYEVIYNAIRDNLPISKDDITYYDSHDTIYSPTIINNYGDDEGEEQDLIDTILDYAIIPKFDTAIAQPMRAALTNGVVIMNNSVTNVIPNEILIVLGACFFLLLFAVVINRMIK